MKEILMPLAELARPKAGFGSLDIAPPIYLKST